MGLLETSGEFEEFKPADLFVAEVEICVVIVISRSYTESIFEINYGAPEEFPGMDTQVPH